MSEFDEQAIENFREYLRIPTVHPNPDYEPCVEFLTKQGNELGLQVRVFRPVSNKPVVVITWEGTNPNFPAILLNSHTDVVPVFEEQWTYPPFEAHMDENGDIFARGAQDMKCVGSMYLEAIRKLKGQGIQLKRTLHLSFVPDEEIGGDDGMATFVKTDDFKQLNIGFSLDESVILPYDVYPVFYGEKVIWQIHVHCPGTPSHGAALFPDTPGEKFRVIINKFLEYRDKMVEQNGPNSNLTSEEVTSVNLTKVYGGVQENVVPDNLSAVFDLRISLKEDLDKFEAMLKKWCEDAGPGVNIEFKQKDIKIPSSDISDTNPFWVAFKSAANKLKLNIKPVICPGTTDSRYLREIGIPAFGFTPINQQPTLLHSHDEKINKDKFLNGIDIYCDILQAIANV